MKRMIILLILLSLLLLGCGSNSIAQENSNCSVPSNTTDDLKDALDMENVVFQDGIWPNKDWENIEFPVTTECVPTRECAVSIAEIIIKNYQQQNLFIDYILQSVFYDTEDQIWIVTFTESLDYPGACVSFAIRKSNMEIVKVWTGE